MTGQCHQQPLTWAQQQCYGSCKRETPTLLQCCTLQATCIVMLGTTSNQEVSHGHGHSSSVMAVASAKHQRCYSAAHSSHLNCDAGYYQQSRGKSRRPRGCFLAGCTSNTSHQQCCTPSGERCFYKGHNRARLALERCCGVAAVQAMPACLQCRTTQHKHVHAPGQHSTAEHCSALSHLSATRAKAPAAVTLTTAAIKGDAAATPQNIQALLHEPHPTRAVGCHAVLIPS